MNRIRILLVEDHAFVREGFRAVLKLEEDFEVIGEAQDGRRAVAMVVELSPDVVLMDIAMPRLNGLEAARQMLAAVPGTKVLMLSAYNDGAYVREAMDSGAAGFLVKQSSGHNVCLAVREVQKGNKFFSPSVAKQMREETGFSGRGPSAARRHRLSSREIEVIQLIAEGKANKETAAELKISVKTVEKHRQNLMAKLRIHDTAGLTRYAISTGIIECTVPLTIV